MPRFIPDTQAGKDLAVFVLAGGRSRRMGSDKAFMELEGKTLLARALELARTLSPSVAIVGPASLYQSHGSVVEDIFPGRGPLSGIHAALSSTSSALNLVLGVDSPFVEPGFLQYLVLEAGRSGAMVTVPRAGGGFQPLCAVYHRNLRDAAQAALEQGNHKVDALFTCVATRIIEEAEMQRFAFDPAMFQNLNTREEFERARARLRALQAGP
ncbi:MAG TPA: molybdenum cofactor guanylyltransferase [Terriglobales bacterium]|nr:molybdenum cofactor guanylyltransferase [Terriglobales bacterium]